MIKLYIGLPQSSILGPLLLNVFLGDLFFVVNSINITSYVDINASCLVADDVDVLIASLGQAIIVSFQNNFL